MIVQFGNRYSLRFAAIAFALSALQFAAFRCALVPTMFRPPIYARIIVGFLACFISIFTVAFGHLSVLPVSRLHTMRTATVHYFMNVAIYFIGSLLWRQAERHAKNVKTSQARLLASFLNQNSKTEHGLKLGFNNIKSYEDFRAKVPLSNYETYRSYVERIERGEQNLLSADKVVHFNVSSGTTGKCKLLPCGKQVLHDFVACLVIPLIYRQKAKYQNRVSPFAPLKNFDLLFVPKWRYASCGLPIGPLSGSISKESLLTTVGRTTPVGCQTYMKEPAQIYIHWLFALYDDEVAGFNGSFAGSALVGMEFIRNNWKQLVNDIRYGTLTNMFDIPEQVVRLVKLPPNPRRANEIEAEFSQGFEGIMQRLWPRINYCWSISTGAHGVYVDRLKWFLGENIPILSPLLAASEAVFGVPMNSEQDAKMRYTLLPGVTFFEFIPESEVGKETPTTLLMHQLEVGKRYELVPTSTVGFYRYRVGDVVKVVDFFHEAPVVEFCTRVGSMLDLHGEKTSEDMIFTALQQAVLQWNGAHSRLVDYTATEGESLAKAVPELRESYLYYALFVEVEGLNRPLCKDEMALFDEALMINSYPYKSFRLKDGIGLPKIFVVKSNTFEALKRQVLERNGAISIQYKTPRYQTNCELLHFLYEQSFRN